ncbi:YdcF family protein [Pseudescherichia vulneris]|uniref:YdcF family protein n=1 Tax=Pseudescherichia vulneris TaxID=566 RepID=UPI0012AC31F7|nr:YdcF family protein [Pseudescherichia vulneris]MDU5454166.1 YdcF family protein [Pseudescherichia vulneris]
MFIPRFPTLPEKTLAAVNALGRWLAQNEFEGKPLPAQADCIILAGNAVIPTIDAACELAAAHKLPLVISGGIGHSTPFLYSAIARHPRYNKVRTTGRTESAIIGDIARQFWKIPSEKLILEERSTNCGENARFSLALLRERGIPLKTLVVVQDPTMQRRTMATFARALADNLNDTFCVSYPGFTPILANGSHGLSFQPKREGLWPVERYLSLIPGELARLRDDSQGYGPNGRDFIVHVDMPDEIARAGEIILADETLIPTLQARSLI